MRNRFPLALVLVCATALSACIRSKPTSETFNWKGPVKADSWLRLRNASGDIDVREGTGDSAEIRLEIERSSAYAPRAEVKVLATSDGILACVLFGDDNSCSATEYRAGNSQRYSTFKFMRGGTKVSGTVLLPRGVKLDVDATNGDVSVASSSRDVIVRTVNGDINASGARGPLDLSTTNGDIDATALGLSGNVKLGTTNGDIQFTMPQGLNALLNMRTVNGDLEFGLPGTITTQTKKSIAATLGSGGSQINLETTNGDVSVRPGGTP
jgi:Putative adhesin